MIEKWAKKQGYESIRQLPGKWKGFDVYEAILGDGLVVGYPEFILVKDDSIRMATPEEGFKIMTFFEN